MPLSLAAATTNMGERSAVALVVLPLTVSCRATRRTGTPPRCTAAGGVLGPAVPLPACPHFPVRPRAPQACLPAYSPCLPFVRSLDVLACAAQQASPLLAMVLLTLARQADAACVDPPASAPARTPPPARSLASHLARGAPAASHRSGTALSVALRTRQPACLACGGEGGHDDPLETFWRRMAGAATLFIRVAAGHGVSRPYETSRAA